MWGYGSFKNLMVLRFLFFFIGFANHCFHFWINEMTLNEEFQEAIRFLTKWGNFSTDIYFLVAGLSMVFLQNASSKSQQKAIESLSRFQHVMIVFQWIIVVVYWTMIHQTMTIIHPNFNEMQFFAADIQHLPHLVFLLIEGFYSNTPLNFTAFNLLYPLIFGLVYLAWNLMYYLRWGIIIYLTCDWSKPAGAIGFVVGVHVFAVLANCVTILYRKLSIRYWVNKVKSE